MIETTLLAIAVLGAAAVYYWKTKEQKSGEYIWVGPGKDPFKER